MMAYGLNTWLPKMMQEFGFSISSSMSFNLILCLGQIAGSIGEDILPERLATEMYSFHCLFLAPSRLLP